MKTKHILTALALPTVFAACTADDIVSENGMQQAERAKLSKDFVLNVNNGVESRYAVEGSTSLNFAFEEGDLIGANLIDAFLPGEGFDPKDPATWPIVNSIAPALPFENVGGVWKSAGELGVGNYLFTNPYNPADKNRAAAKYEFPAIVKYDAKNPNAHIEAYNKAVAATILREDDQEASINLKNLFAYPKLVMKFAKDAEVTKVDKVILKAAEGSEFIVKGALHHQKIAEMFNPEELEEYLEDNKANKATEADYWAQFETTDFVIDTDDEKQAYEGYAELSTSPYIIYEVNQAVSGNKFEIRLMLPSIKNLMADNAEITMYVVTDKGGYKANLTDDASYEFKQTTLEGKIKKALTRNSSNTLTIKALEVAEQYELNNLQIENIVSDSEDWNILVAKYGDLEKYSAAYKAEEEAGKVDDADELAVNIINSDFTLTSDLDMPEVAEFVIKSDVKVEGEVTLKNIKVEGKLIVKKGATLTTDATLDAANVEVEEGGNLVFTAVYDEDDKLTAYDKIETICNHGTVTVPAGVEATFTLNNADKAAVLNVGAAASRAAEVAAVANLTGYNYGIINNYGVINADDFVNNAPAELVNNEKIGYKYDAEKGEWNAVPTVNNFATFNAKGSVTNYGLFVNNSVLTSNFVNAAEFINATVTGANYVGTLEVKAGAETYIDSNEGAEIILAELTPAKGLTIYKARKNADYNPAATNFKYRGTIKYTLNEKSTAALDLSNSPVNYLVANTDVEIAKTYTWTDSSASPAVTNTYALKTLEVTDGIVKLAARTGAGTQASPYKYPAQVGELIVNGEVEIDGEYYTPMISNLTVNAGGVFGVPAEALLQISLAKITTAPADEDLEEGKVSVVGTLVFTETHADNATGVTTWPKGSDGKYTAADFYNKNIEINKDAEVKCAANGAPANTNPKEKAYNTSSMNLYQISEDSWYKNQPSGATYTVTINSALDMNAVVKDTNKNSNYASVLANAEEVILNGANVTNLTNAMGVTSAKMTISGDSDITGTSRMVVWTVDELEFTGNYYLRLNGGCWIEINVTAQKNMGCEAIKGLSGVPNGVTKLGDGKVVAKDINGEYLQWNFNTGVWEELN